MVRPPPMPKSPATNPTTHPMTRNTGMSVKSKLGFQHFLRDESPLARIDGGDRQPVAARENAHAFELRPRSKLVERDEPCFLDEGDLDVHPAGCIACRFRVEVGAFLVELRLVGIRRLADLHYARNTGLGAARVVEECEIADLHLVAHEVPGLVIPHAVPGDRLFRHAGEVVDRDVIGFGFYQPVAHVLSLVWEWRGATICMRAPLNPRAPSSRQTAATAHRRAAFAIACPASLPGGPDRAARRRVRATRTQGPPRRDRHRPARLGTRRCRTRCR